MRIYNIINIPKGLSPEFECDCREEYNSGYTEGLEEGFGKGYDSGYTDGAESVDCEDFYDSGYTDGYESGYTSGYTDGQASVDCTDFYNSGVTDGYASGYTSGRTDGYDDGWQPGYDSGRTDGEEAGYEEGKEYQKTLLVSTAITANGTYEREDGFNQVVVNVPSMSGAGYDSGYTDGYESGYTDGSEDGFDSGYTSGVTDGYASGYTSGKTDGFDAGYDSGVTDGYASGKTDAWQPAYDSGYTDGAAEQKAKMISTTIIGNGTYTREDGWNKLVVNIPGYGEGYVEGEAAQKAKLVPTAVTENGTYSREDGFSQIVVNVPDRYDEGYNSGYTSGKTDGFGEGYDSGYTDGYDERAAMLTAMTITANGAYESVEGWSAVTVNVPQTGRTENKEVYLSRADFPIIHPQAGIPEGEIWIGTRKYYSPSSGYIGMGTFFLDAELNVTDIYVSGHTSGVTDGAAQQKALLTSTAFTANGTYTRENGWSAVTVNVSGYSYEDLVAAYMSGNTAGYHSGYTDGLSACTTDFTKDYLTIEALSAGTLYWGTYSSSEVRTIEWSKDEGRTWSSVTPVFMDSQNPSGTVVTTVNPGDKVLFKGDNYRYAPPLGGNGCSFKTDFEYAVYGNIMSLINSVDFPSGNVPLQSEDVFANLFRDNTGLISAGNLKLPATAVSNAAEYYSMFRGCVNLRTAPDLTNAVRFDCTAMFSGCTSLTYVKCLALNPPTSHTTGWLRGVSPFGTFVKHPDATWTRGVDGIPENWSIVDAEI